MAERTAMKAMIEALQAQLALMQANNEQVKEKVGEMEKEIETGMEQAKKEVREEVSSEMKEMEERSSNIVVYGAPESEKNDEEEKEEDAEIVERIAAEIGVEVKGSVEVKFRAGAKTQGKKRPLIIKMTDEGTREAILQKAYLLGRKTGWKDIFVSPDLTKKQREEGKKKKKEKELKDERDRLNDVAKNEGRTGGEYRVRTVKGERKVVWWEERAPRR